MPLILSESEVRAAISPRLLVDELASGFARLSAGRASSIPRSRMRVGETAHASAMMAEDEVSGVCAKILVSDPTYRESGWPTLNSVIVLFNHADGRVRAVVDASWLGAARTAATSMLSAELVSTRTRSVAVIGGALLARTHAEFASQVLLPDEIRVFSRDPSDAKVIANAVPQGRVSSSLEEAIADADVVCLCTRPTSPVLRLDMVEAGQHITSIGAGELADDLVEASLVCVESTEATEPPPVGSQELAGLDPEDVYPLGDLLRGTPLPRSADRNVTVYKSMGHAIEDLTAAAAVVRRVEELELGITADFG